MKTNTSKSNYDNSFRDAISTVDTDGKRIFLHPTKPPKRKFFNARVIVSIVLLTLLFGVPFIKIGGQPLLLLNVIDRKFFIFGQLFVPQDFHIFGFGMLLFMVFIVLLTVVWGRFWCGWLCPQTIFMEMVYRRVEYWIEGDAPAQKRLNKQDWNSEKIRKKLTKHTLFVLISFLLANMALSYFIGVERLQEMMTGNPTKNWATFVAVMITSATIYYIYASFREQICTTFCPYGRLQGVLLDKKSVIVSYDYKRGEPRGKVKKQAPNPKIKLVAFIDTTPQLGDCIDCNLCVRVCPTGIDIRNGTQMECVNCTACMDACDSIMEKVDRPEGLIRYASEEEIETGVRTIWNARSIAYTIVSVLLLGIMGFMLTSRNSVETTIMRAPGQLYQKADNGDIRNLYTLQIANKTVDDMAIELKLSSHSGELTVVGNTINLKGKEIVDGVFFIQIPKKELDGIKTEIEIKIYSEGKLLEKVETNFMGPNKISRKSKVISPK
jgi:cytochrome c oxidase accessory protein FixG